MAKLGTERGALSASRNGSFIYAEPGERDIHVLSSKRNHTYVLTSNTAYYTAEDRQYLSDEKAAGRQAEILDYNPFHLGSAMHAQWYEGADDPLKMDDQHGHIRYRTQAALMAALKERFPTVYDEIDLALKKHLPSYGEDKKPQPPTAQKHSWCGRIFTCFNPAHHSYDDFHSVAKDAFIVSEKKDVPLQKRELSWQESLTPPSKAAQQTVR